MIRKDVPKIGKERVGMSECELSGVEQIAHRLSLRDGFMGDTTHDRWCLNVPLPEEPPVCECEGEP